MYKCLPGEETDDFTSAKSGDFLRSNSAGRRVAVASDFACPGWYPRCELQHIDSDRRGPGVSAIQRKIYAAEFRRSERGRRLPGFSQAPTQDADKKIKLGLAFINKYTKDIYTETVYVELIETYYANRDFDNFYAYSDKALSIFPDDVPALALTGWVIPRVYQPNEPG